jgi:DNA recombination protein RmuC
MEIFFIIIIFLACFGLFFYILNQKFKGILEREKNDQGILMLQNQLNELTKAVDGKLSESHQVIHAQSNITHQIYRELSEKLAKLEETNKQVMSFTDQLQSLQDILKNPKQRGILGEFYLETLLKNVLPPNTYKLQYNLGKDENGADLIVDAAIFIQKKIIPIDAKFSLDNYNKIVAEKNESEREKLEKLFKQDLKNRIDETAKYIRPEKDTLDFAFMFIPAEAIYYDLLVNQVGAVKVSTRDLLEYAFQEKRVIIVSPTSFFAYLQTVLQGLRALQIEESAKEIRKRIEILAKHLLNYDEYLKKLGNNLTTVVNSYNTAYKEFAKIDKDVVKIAGGEKQIEPLSLEKPKSE